MKMSKNKVISSCIVNSLYTCVLSVTLYGLDGRPTARQLDYD